jgi:heme exporter protein B
MILFALLILFIAQVGLGGGEARAGAAGPVVFWIAILFAGTVGLSQSFAAEREGNTLGGVITAPIDLGVYYLAKVLSTSLYVLVMELVVLLAYAVLFNVSPWGHLLEILLVLAVFTFAYLAIGVVLAAMTSALRGAGEVLLRILLFPLMIPMIWLTLRVSETVFDTVIAGGALGPPLSVARFAVLGLAFDALYLTAGYLLFPKVLEE